MRPRAKSSNVLLAEDDGDLSGLVQHWCTRAGWSVTCAADGAEAMHLAKRPGFDILLSDLRMPSATGIDVIEESKRSHPWRPAILLTAFPEGNGSQRRWHEPADDLLLKPLHEDVVVGRVARWLASRPRSEREGTSMIVAVGAHPDDVEVGCGGALARHKAQGDAVVILTMTRGTAGGCRVKRTLEAYEAASLAGAELVLGDLPDTRLSCDPEAIAIIEEVIQRTQPSVVYTHSAHDNHQDHRAVHAATLVAARRVPRVFAYQSPSCTVDFRPNLFVDIEPFLDHKLRLVDVFASQTVKCPYLEAELLVAMARYWGRLAGCRMVEAMEVLRTVDGGFSDGI